MSSSGCSSGSSMPCFLNTRSTTSGCKSGGQQLSMIVLSALLRLWYPLLRNVTDISALPLCSAVLNHSDCLVQHICQMQAHPVASLLGSPLTRDASGETAVHYAVQSSNHRCMDLLLKSLDDVPDERFKSEILALNPGYEFDIDLRKAQIIMCLPEFYGKSSASLFSFNLLEFVLLFSKKPKTQCLQNTSSVLVSGIVFCCMLSLTLTRCRWVMFSARAINQHDSKALAKGNFLKQKFPCFSDKPNMSWMLTTCQPAVDRWRPSWHAHSTF